MKMKTYAELASFSTFEDRFEYLRLAGGIGRSTFGFDRYINQTFYASREWGLARQEVFIRDNGCDLGMVGYEIHQGPLIHHMNPMTVDDILQHEEWIIDPEFLITTTHITHNSIHFGGKDPYPKVVLARTPRDTKLW